MTKKVGGPSGWINKLQVERAGVAPKPGAAKPAQGDAQLPLAPRAAIGADLGERLATAKIPEKIAKEHGAALEGALADATAIARHVDALEPWRTRAIERIVEQTYKAVGLALSQAPNDVRAALAKQTIASLRTLVETMGRADALGPTMNAALGLFELGLRLSAKGLLTSKPAELVTAMGAARDAVLPLAEHLSRRPGAGTALNVFPVLVEQLERAEGKLTPARRAAIWAEVAAFVAETGPKTGFRQETSAELAKAVFDALEAKLGGTTATLAGARERFLATFELPRKELEDQLAAPAPALADAGANDAWAKLDAALHTLVAAHPATSDGLRQTFGQLRAVLLNELAVARPAQLGAANYWPVAAALVERFAKTELAEHTLALLTDLLPVLRQNGAAAAAFAAIDAALPGPELARALAMALAETSPHRLAGLPGLTDALDGLEALSEHAAMQALFALAPTLRTAQPASAASIVTHVLELAKLGGRDDQLGMLRDFAARETGVFDALVRYNLQAREPARRPEVARAIALASSGAKLEVNTVNALGSLVRSLEASFPQVKVEQLAAASDGGVFTLVDPAVRYRHPVQQLFDQLAPTIGRAGVQNLGPDTQNDGARLALRLTAVIANLDGEYAIPLQRIRADLDAAFRDPGKLRLPPNVDALAMRAFAQAPSVSAYVAAVPELPLELALTAGLHLAPEQLAWVSEKMAAVAGRDTKRALRDLVFACVTHGRLDLLEAARTTKAPTKAVSKLVSFVAKSYRENRMHEVQFDALIAGLKRDEDPIAAIEKAKIDETLAKLNLAELAGPNAKLDPAGLAEIAKSGEALTYLFQNYRQGYVYDGIDHGPLEGVLKDVLRSVATGTWPRSRYETEGGRQMLARLTPEQQALWKQEQVTPLKDAGNAAEQAELTDAMSLLRGLAKALTMEVKLDVPGLGALAWDAASLAKVEAHYAAEVAKIRDVPKGTPEHKARSSALGATREALVLLRLHAAVSGRQGDAKTVLLAIKEPLAEAASALRKRGLKGAAEAATRIGFVARDVKTSPKQGTYATDEDGLHALLTTCTGGCIHYTNVRRWALASLAANANERILRVYEGDRFVGRAILKFYGVKMDGYEGPALWINQYNVNGGGATPEHQKLLAKHALLKAKAMGIPVLSSYCDMTAAARDLGVAVVQKQASLQIDDGVTGLQFLDYLLRAPGNGGYAYETKKFRGAAPHFEAAPLNVNVVMPA